MPKLSKLSDKDVMYIFLIKEQVNFLSHVEKRLFKVDNALVQYKSCPVVKEITFAFEYPPHTCSKSTFCVFRSANLDKNSKLLFTQKCN